MASCLCLCRRCRHPVPELLVVLPDGPVYQAASLAAGVALRAVVVAPAAGVALRAVVVALAAGVGPRVVVVARVAPLLDPAPHVRAVPLAGRAAFAVEQLEAVAHPGVAAVHARVEHLAVHVVRPAVAARGVLPPLPVRAE
jgi:hypothetical protein